MRKNSLIYFIVLLWVVLPLTLSFLKSEKTDFPTPTDTLVRFRSEAEEEEERRLRDEWVNSMHKAAPGVDWKAMDRNYRLRRFLSSRIGTWKTASADTLANGQVVGEWTERGSVNQAGRMVVADLDTLNNLIYAGSAGGIVWRGNPDGTNWTPLNDGFRFPALKRVQALPHNGGTRILAVSGGSKVWYTDDQGMNWDTATGIANLSNWGYIRRAVVAEDSLRTIYLMAQEWDYTDWNAVASLYQSTDKGNSFALVRQWDEPTYGPIRNFDVWVARYGNASAFVIAKDSVYQHEVTTGLTYRGALPAATNPNNLLSGYLDTALTRLYLYRNSDVYRSDDSGKTWAQTGSVGMSPFAENSFSVSLSDPDRLFFGEVDAFYSTNAGQSWNRVNNWWEYYGSEADKLHADIPSVESVYRAGGQEIQLIGTDGGLYVSDDGLQTVDNLSLFGLNVSQYYSVYTDKNDPDYVYAGSQDQGFQRCQSDSGTILGFDQLISGDYGHIVSADGGQSIWMVYPGFADYYSNARTGFSTATWTFAGYPFWIPPLMADPYFSNRVYLAGGNVSGSGGSHMISLRYFGGNIVPFQESYDFAAASGGGNISAMEYSPLNKDQRYVLTDNGKFFRSSDAGQTWTLSPNFSGPDPHYFYGADILASPGLPGTVYAAGSGYSNPAVYVSKDYGLNWAPADNGLPPTLVFQLASNADGSLLFAATEVGPFVYVASENTWYSMGDGPPDQTYWTVDYIPALQVARFGTYGRGIWDFSLSQMPVAHQLAEDLLAVKTWPNPVQDLLWIEAEGKDEALDLELINVSGKVLIRKRAVLQQGRISLDLSSLASGIYFLKISGSKGELTQKIIRA